MGNKPITKRHITVWFHFCEVPKRDRFRELEIRMVAAMVVACLLEKNGELFNGYELSVY
jgi:hypothetical protein